MIDPMILFTQATVADEVQGLIEGWNDTNLNPSSHLQDLPKVYLLQSTLGDNWKKFYTKYIELKCDYFIQVWQYEMYPNKNPEPIEWDHLIDKLESIMLKYLPKVEIFQLPEHLKNRF